MRGTADTSCLTATRTDEVTMRTRELPLRLMQSALILITVLCVVAATPLAAQQVSDSARVSGASAAPAVSPSAAQAGLRSPEPRFQPYRPNLFSNNTAASAAGAAGEGGSHTIVLSTLALVLIVVIVVLLVVR
jgi:Tfp pilus assembly protein PilX